MSFKLEVSDDGGRSYASNALRFATEEEAERYKGNILSRWMAATDARVAPSEDPVNYTADEYGHANRIEA